MSIKLKALGLGLLAMLAMGAFAAMNAGATTGGHFVFSHHTVAITGTEEGVNHRVHFWSKSDWLNNDVNKKIGCEISSYTGTHTNDAATPTTTTSMTITPKWEKCYTTGEPNNKFEVHENGCHLVFTVRPEPDKNHNTVDVCPSGGAIVITHPNCEITVSSQTVGGGANDGVLYTRVVENGVHAVTLDATVWIKSQYHGGICVFLGTNQEATMVGSATVRGTSGGAASGITAT